jgi:hypothetical protein
MCERKAVAKLVYGWRTLSCQQNMGNNYDQVDASCELHFRKAEITAVTTTTTTTATTNNNNNNNNNIQ